MDMQKSDIKVEQREMQRQTREFSCCQKLEEARREPLPERPEGVCPATALISDFQSLELWENTIVLV